MNNSLYRKIFARFNLAAAILLPVWWLLMGTLLPVAVGETGFGAMILHPNWVPVNVVGMVACACWLIALPFYSMVRSSGNTATGLIGQILAAVGVAWFGCIQYYETFLWPVVAQSNPELLDIEGPLVFGDPLIVTPLILSGIVLSVGYLLIVIGMSGKEPRLSVTLRAVLLAGILLFANGIVVPVRSVGLLMLSISMAWFSVTSLREVR